MRRLVSPTILVAVLSLSTFPTPAHTQDRSPELQRLGFLAGAWSFEMDRGAAGTETCQWLGEQFVQCHDVFETSPEVTQEMLGVWGYDADRAVYVWDRYWSQGRVDHSVGWITGNTWTFLLQIEGSPRRLARLTMTEDSPTTYSFKWESCIEGQDWVPSSAGTATRVQ